MSSSSPSLHGKPKPLMLKDFLRDDPNSDSFSGFRTAPKRSESTVRYLLEVEFRNGSCIGGRGRLLRSRSKLASLTKISAMLNAVRMLPFTSTSSSAAAKSSPKQGILPRSFSKRLLTRSFWKRRGCEERVKDHSYESCRSNSSGSKILVRDIVRLESFVDESRGGKPININYYHPPSPTASSRRNSCCASEWSESDSAASSESDSFPCSSSPSSSEFAKSDSSPVVKRTKEANPMDTSTCSPTTTGVGGDSMETATCRRDSKGEGNATMEYTSHQYDEKEQLSPVSVMDFPSEEDDDEEEEEAASPVATASSPSPFHQSLANIDKTRHHLLQKIRRFESLALLVDSVDLSESFEAEAEEEEDDEEVFDVIHVGEEARAGCLLEQLKSCISKEKLQRIDDCDELQLLDFFIEGLSSSAWRRRRTWEEDRTVEKELLIEARDWVNGSGWGMGGGWGRRGEVEIREMEKNGRWRCFDEEEEEITASVECEVLESLLDEVFLDLISPFKI